MSPGDPADAKLAALIRSTLSQHLTSEETAIIGRTAQALGTTDAAQRYRFVTTDWAVKNAKQYFGDDAPVFTGMPALKVEAAVIQALK